MRSSKLRPVFIRNRAEFGVQNEGMKRLWQKFGLLFLLAGALAFMALPAVLAMTNS